MNNEVVPLENAIDVLMSTYEGRQALSSLLSASGVFSEIEDGVDAITSARIEGRRSLGVRLLNSIFTNSSDKFTVLIEEARDRNERNRQLISDDE